MAVAFDVAGTATTSSGTAPSCSINPTAGSNVYAFFLTDRNSTLSSVTCGGTSMTQMTNSPVTLPNGAAGNAVLFIYKLANVSTGSQTVAGTLGTSSNFICDAVSYTGVNSEGTPTTNTGTSQTPQITVSAPAAGNLTIGIIAELSTAINSVSGGTNRVLFDGSFNTCNFSESDTTSGVTFSQSLSAAEAWGAFAAELKASAGAQTLTPSGVPTAEAFGAPTVTQIVTLSGIATAETFGAPTVTQIIAPSGIATTETFGAPAVAPVLTPTGIATTETFGALAIAQIVTPAGVSTSEAFGSLVSTLFITPLGVGPNEVFGAPAIAPTLLILPAGIAGAEAFGAPTLSTTAAPVLAATSSQFVIVPAETRTVIVPARTRAIVVPPETRTTVVSATPPETT